MAELTGNQASFLSPLPVIWPLSQFSYLHHVTLRWSCAYAPGECHFMCLLRSTSEDCSPFLCFRSQDSSWNFHHMPLPQEGLISLAAAVQPSSCPSAPSTTRKSNCFPAKHILSCLEASPSGLMGLRHSPLWDEDSEDDGPTIIFQERFTVT